MIKRIKTSAGDASEALVGMEERVAVIAVMSPALFLSLCTSGMNQFVFRASSLIQKTAACGWCVGRNGMLEIRAAGTGRQQPRP